MRIIKTFLFFVVAIFVVIGGGYYGGREAALWWNANQIMNDLRFLARTNQWQSLESQCYAEGGILGARQLQLRFLNDSEYVLEMQCQSFTQIEMQRKTLPFRVVKTTGTAGFVYDVRSQILSGEITLEFMGQKRLVSIQNNEPSTTWGETVVVSDSLVSSCGAHGLTCCDPVLEIGEGEPFRTGVNDCQEQCFAGCIARPNLILFQTDPLLDPVARKVELDKQVPTVFFRYAYAVGTRPLREVKIVYGDGTEETSPEPSGEFIKEYACAQETCTYHAVIQAVDQSGIPSAETRIAEIDIVLGSR